MIELKRVFVVHFFESERGWGSDSWSIGYNTEKEARDAVKNCNKDNPKDHVPDYYVVATYIGEKFVKP